MSVLFPQVRKPREWDYRPIYYDPEKEERHEKLKKLQDQRAMEEADKARAEGRPVPEEEGGFHTHLHRGSFREAAGLQSEKVNKSRETKAKLYAVILIILLTVFFYFL